MVATHPDPFEEFAEECRLRLTIEELSAAPRDVRAPPLDHDRFFIVTVAGPAPENGQVRLLFVTGGDGDNPPGTRDVLWWVASDSWAVEESGRRFKRWASTYGHPEADPAGRRLFQLHENQ